MTQHCSTSHVYNSQVWFPKHDNNRLCTVFKTIYDKYEPENSLSDVVTSSEIDLSTTH